MKTLPAVNAVAAANRARSVVRVGTRGSRLALIQTDLTLAALRKAHPDIHFEVVTVTTQGDANQSAPLAGMGLGVFVKEIERRLEIGDIDMAVHSLKDMPTVLPDGMTIGAVLQRADPRDVLVSHLGTTLEQFPRWSPHRHQQPQASRPDRRETARSQHRPHPRQRGHPPPQSRRRGM